MDISDAEQEVNLVPVEIVNITEDCKQDRFCRIFQIPDDWNEEDVLKRIR